MAVIEKEWLSNDVIDSQVVSNNTYIKGRNFADTADIDIIKVNASDNLEFATVPYVSADPSNDNQLTRKSYITSSLANYIPTSQKGAASGVCPLDASTKISSTYLPSYVDDVEEYADLASFPATGESGKIYVAIDTLKTYRWSGSSYTEISVGAVSSVNTKTGVVTLVTDDIAEDGTPTNLWFTDARAKAAAVANSITDGVTDVAPSQDAVYDALASKQASGNYITALTGEVTASGPGSASATVTNSAVLGKVLTGFIAGAGTVADTDNILQALQKIVGNINAFQGADSELYVKELDATDITNQYIDLPYESLVDSCVVWPIGGPIQTPTTDYTLSYTGGVGSVTRLTFAGDLASKLVATKKLAVKYLKA